MNLQLREVVRLLVCDIDGCLSGGSASHFSIDLLQRLQELNVASKSDPSVPAVTYCTGRPQPYVDCLLQATGGYMPALCEGGAVFFDPRSHIVETHAGFGDREADRLEELRHAIRHGLHDPRIMFEPGKVTHVTLLLASPLRPADVVEKAQQIAAQFGDEFEVETTRICVHFLFRHLHKGTGIEWLAERTGITPVQMAGVGDARPDIPFLKMVGVACAPENAHEDVKAACQVVSRRPEAEATLEFIEMLLAANRRLLGGKAA